MNRKKSREVAMKLLFESHIKKESYITIIDDLKESIDIEKENTSLSSFGEKKETDIESIDLEDVDMAYVVRVLKGIETNKENIDSNIEKYLKNWKLNRLSNVDLAILRVAVYELLFEEDIPERVSVNEAVELAKKFSEDKSPAFINGILNNFIN